MAKKIELLNDQKEVVHPLTSADCVVMENGKTLDEVMGDGIATPTITHEGTSFQVGVGDSNIEVVDGDVAGMTLKGQSYQNILPKPTTLIMETDEKEFKINDKIDSNIIIDDNIAEIATVKGLTYVNTVQEESASEYVVMEQDYSGQGEVVVESNRLLNVVDYSDVKMYQATTSIINGVRYYDLNEGPTVNDSYVTPMISNQYLYKPNTDYTIIVNIIENTTGKKLGISNIKAAFNYSKDSNDKHIRDFANLTGVSKLLVHTFDDIYQPGQGNSVVQLAYFGMWNASSQISEGKHIKFSFMIIEGNHLDADIPYFEKSDSCVKGISLEGQTLVNTIQEPCEAEYAVVGEELSGQGVTVYQPDGLTNLIAGKSQENSHFTDYKLSCVDKTKTYFVKITSTKEIIAIGFIVDDSTWNSKVECEITNGYVIIKPDETLELSTLRVVTSDSTTSYTLETMLIEYQEGMENLDLPYFEGTRKFNQGVMSLEGMTLTDLKKSDETVRVEIPSSVTYTVTKKDMNHIEGTITTLNGATWGYVHVPIKRQIIKPSTKYLVKGNLQNISRVILGTGDSTVSWSSFGNVNVAKNYAIIKTYETLATDSDSNPIRLYFDINRADNTTFSIKDLVFIEYQDGLENLDIPYFVDTKFFDYSTPRHINGATLDGMSLVNLLQFKARANFMTYSNGTLTITNPTAAGNCSFSTEMLKPSTKYFYKATYVCDSTWTTAIRHDLYPDTFEEFEGYTPTTSPTEYYFTFTTPSDITELSTFRVYVPAATSGTATVSNMMLLEYQEGMENLDIPYFEGMKSVENPVVEVTGKNLFNFEEWYQAIKDINGISRNGNMITFDSSINSNIASTVRNAYDYIGEGKYKPNTQYTLSFNRIESSDSTFHVGFSFIYTDGTTDKQQTNDGYVVAISKPNKTVKYIRFSWSTQVDKYVSSLSNIQIEESSVATSYEPYKSTTIQSKNIFDGVLGNNFITDATGEPYSEAGSGVSRHRYTVNHMSCNSNTEYQLYIKPGTSNYYGVVQVYYYDKDKQYLSLYHSIPTTDKTQETTVNFTAPNNSNIAYMRFRFYKPDDVTDYTEATLDTFKVIPLISLRAISDVKDELDLSAGTLIQRLCQITINENYSWTLDGENNGYLQFGTALETKANTIGEVAGISSGIPYGTLDKEGTQEQVIVFEHNSWITQLRVMINPSRLEASNVDGFKEYIKNNPFELIYAQQSIIHKIDLQTLDQDDNEVPTLKLQTPKNIITTSSDYLVPNINIPATINYDTIIKPSTQYTLRFNQDVNTDNPLTVNLGGTEQVVTSNHFTMTTPETLTHNQLQFNGKGNVVSKVQVIEGDVTGIKYPFFEGIGSVDKPKMVATGKNLLKLPSNLELISGYTFDMDVTNSNGTITLTGKATDTKERYVVTGNAYAYLEGGKTYTISFESDAEAGMDSGTDTVQIFLAWNNKYGSEEKFEFHTIHTKTKTITPNLTGNYYLRLDLNDGTKTHKIYNIQVEEGSVATPYEPYREPIIVQQDVDSIPLTSDMFEQGNILGNNLIEKMSFQQFPLQSKSNRIKAKSLIPVKPNSQYTITNLSTVRVWAYELDKDGLYVNKYVDTTNDGTFENKTSFKTNYLAVMVANTDDSDITPSTLDSLNLALQEVPQEIVLRGIGDVKDTLDLSTGEYVQRIGVINNISQITGAYFSSSYMVGDKCALLYNLKNDMPKLKRNPDTTTFPPMYASNFTDTSTMQLGSSNGAWTNTNQQQTQNICTISTVNKDYDICMSIPNSLTGVTSTDNTVTTIAEKFNSYIKSLDNFEIHYILETPIIHKVNLTNMNKIPSYASKTYYNTELPTDSLIPNITIPSTINYDVAIKPSTQYTIRANTQDALTVDLGGTTGTLSNGKATITTPGTLTHNELKLGGNGKAKEVMVIEGNEIKDNVPFFNGMKNVEMGGIKLVNIARRLVTYNTFITANTNKTEWTYTDTGYYGNIEFDKTLLKSNTTYTIYLNVTKNTSTVANPILICLSKGESTNPTLTVGQTGTIKITVTTKDKLDDVPRFAFKNSTLDSVITIQNPMIIEGDWTHLDEIPYIESEMIIEQPIIESQGKNLLDLESKPFTVASTGTTFTKSGSTYTVTTLANSTAYDYIRRVWTVDNDKWLRNVRGKELTLSVSSISCSNSNSLACIQFRIECEDGSKTYPGIHASLGETMKTFVMPANAKNLQMQIMTNNTGAVLTEDTTLTVSNVQLELGDTVTSYEPYKHQTLYSNRVIGYEEGCYHAHSNGGIITDATQCSMLADVEGLNVAYITNGGSNYSFYDKDGVYISGKATLDTSLSMNNKNGFITVPSNAKFMRFASSINGTTDYTKATVTGELPLRSLPNGVCDTLNLVTGEYVQNVGERVLKGSEDWKDAGNNNSVYMRFQSATLMGTMKRNNAYIHSDKIPNGRNTTTEEFIKIGDGDNSYFYINIKREKLPTQDADGFKQYLSQNPITVQYELATPIVRKLGFTTKGNYTQSNLATDCKWGASPTIANNTLTTRYRTTNAASLPIVYNAHLFSNDFPIRYFNVDAHKDYEYISNMEYGQYVNVRRDKLEADTVEAFSKWLQQNPIEVGYITWEQSSESYSNIHKPIFFNNANVQFLSYNLDIQPQLTLQARTRNSYVLDMAKSNTRYTVKAFSNPHDFYIDGKSFGKGTNGCITTPTLTNRLLVTGSSDVKELMIIEGDVTNKNLPYFKGILSSYHDVDEIEIYNANKNLFDVSKVKQYVDNQGNSDIWWSTTIKGDEVISVRGENTAQGQFGAYLKVDVRPNSTYTLHIEMEKDGSPYGGQIYIYENEAVWGNAKYVLYANVKNHIQTTNNAKYVTIGFNYGKDFPTGTTLVSKNMVLYLGEESSNYIPHSHNTTLIEMPTRLETVKVVRPVLVDGALDVANGTEWAGTTNNCRTDFIPVEPKEFIHVRNGSGDRLSNILCYDINKNFICYLLKAPTQNGYVPENCYFIRLYWSKSNVSDLTITRQAHKPIQLNSLPNGVCDEIIIKPNSNKAQLVQRVGKQVFDGSEGWGTEEQANKDFVKYVSYVNDSSKKVQGICISNQFYGRQDGEANNAIRVGTGGRLVLCSNKYTSKDNLIQNLQQNPLTVYYELATPITHEIELQGYPYVYEENGTVTLNTDTPHQTVISYNVDQQQLITTQNETIIRHDQQIDDLYYYIELYLEEIYQMELFRLQVELSL